MALSSLSREDPLWGTPRINGELLKLGRDIGETSVSKYMVRRRNPPTQTCGPSLFAHDSRRIVHFNVAAHSTAEWTGQQLRGAFPFGEVPRYLLRDRDGIFGADFPKAGRTYGHLTNAWRCDCAANSPGEAQNSGSTEYPRSTGSARKNRW